jgi:hypothetical protein
MLNISQNSMEKGLYVLLMNHGLPTHFGMHKYVSTL